jgi:LysM repeat protein
MNFGFTSSVARRLVAAVPPVVAAVAFVLGTAASSSAQSLRGSSSSLDWQNEQAKEHDFSYLNRRQDVARMVGAGLLVPVEGGAHYRLTDVSFKVARPEVRVFIERLSSQYYAACGSPLVVTSLTRPTAYQPSNASVRSVHPTGMAVDLRVPTERGCRQWLESTLLALEGQKVLDVTLERNPPHYHVALFPGPYIAYVASMTGRSKASVVAAAPTAPPSRTASSASRLTHTVKRGETLWRIAQAYDTTPVAIRRANRLPSATIRPGQRLTIPTSGD